MNLVVVKSALLTEMITIKLLKSTNHEHVSTIGKQFDYSHYNSENPD